MSSNIHLQQHISQLCGDLETPISLFMKLMADTAEGILLETAEVDGRWGRYSVLVRDFAMVITCQEGTLQLDIRDERLSPIAALHGKPFMEGLRALLQQIHLSAPTGQGSTQYAPITRALYGYLGYEMAGIFQPKLASSIPVAQAECSLALPRHVIVFDHLYNKLVHLSLEQPPVLPTEVCIPPAPSICGKVSQNPTQEQYVANVQNVKGLLQEGEAIQVVLSTQSSVDFTGIPFDYYRRMRRINPSPYMFYMALPGINLFGSSPELLVRCVAGKLQLSPIAGTRKRGETEEEDSALAAELLQDPKERAEHVMLVDLGRNDLGQVAKPGSVHLERLMVIERFSHVMHITSHVTAQLRPELDALDLLAATFPAGTVSGAPKVRAMEIIAECEPTPRGPYAGCIGWIGLDHDAVHLDMGITIRSMWTRKGKLHWQAGAGIVHDSCPEFEWTECQNKAKIIHAVLKGDQ